MDTGPRVTIVVLTKVPVPGRVKTRLCPPLSFADAALLAEAALRDTFAAVLGAPAARRVGALDGEPGAWFPPAFDAIAQRGYGLDERIESAFEDVGGPAILIGSDTPQVSPGLLARAARTLLSSGVDAVVGPAMDGGWWIAGLRRPAPNAFRGVPMSTATTGAEQYARFRHLGLSVAMLPVLRDVDVIEDAYAVAAEAPDSMFAAAFREVSGRRAIEPEKRLPSLARG